MTGTASPGNEGPSFGPPQLPAGWIAQWDGASRKYYYVQLSTGVSQWDVPTEAAKTGNTPGQAIEHPYGTPQPELITHPDGSQTVKHADGTMEPIMADGSRGVEGPNGERGIGVSDTTETLPPSSAMFELMRECAEYGGQRPAWWQGIRPGRARRTAR